MLHCLKDGVTHTNYLGYLWEVCLSCPIYLFTISFYQYRFMDIYCVLWAWSHGTYSAAPAQLWLWEPSVVPLSDVPLSDVPSPVGGLFLFSFWILLSLLALQNAPCSSSMFSAQTLEPVIASQSRFFFLEMTIESMISTRCICCYWGVVSLGPLGWQNQGIYVRQVSGAFTHNYKYFCV